MKMRTIKLTPKQLTDILVGKTGAISINLPTDTELLNIKSDLQAGEIIAVVRSESFEDVPDAYPIPEIKITTTATTRIAAPTSSVQKVPSFLSSALLKTEPAPSHNKSEQAPKKPIQNTPKPNTSLLEEEFSAEQRKLLSFMVEGNILVVKPVKFLKAEWDDINEVVRSLNGRWVKGEIISYWEIPLSQS